MNTITEKIQYKTKNSHYLNIHVWVLITINIILFIFFLLNKNPFIVIWWNIFCTFFLVYIFKKYCFYFKNKAFITETKFIYQENNSIKKTDFSQIKEIKIQKIWIRSNYFWYWSLIFITNNWEIKLDYINNPEITAKEIIEIIKS